jgi:hypothetical protein
MHLAMKSLLLDGDTLDCLAISSHLSRFFSAAELRLAAGAFAAGGFAAEAAEGWAGAVVAGERAAEVAGRASFFFAAAAVSGFFLVLAETQALM